MDIITYLYHNLDAILISVSKRAPVKFQSEHTNLNPSLIA